MCQLEKDMFEVEEDGITCNFEANGLEKTLTKLIERHNQYVDRSKVSHDIEMIADFILTQYINTDNEIGTNIQAAAQII